MYRKKFSFSLLTLFGVSALTVGCGVSEVKEPLLNVSERGKQECLKRSDLVKNSFTAKQIYDECLEIIDERLAQQDAFEAELFYERKRQEEALKKQKAVENKQKAVENKKLKSELKKLKAEKRKRRQEKKRLTAAKNKKKIEENDCKEGSIIGGVLGAGLTMSSTRGKDRWWAVPLGAGAGALVGCQVDGG